MKRHSHRAPKERALRRLAVIAVQGRGRLVVGVVVAQVIAMAAALAQPTLNARIIDDGVIAGDVGYIQRMGAVMLGVAVCGLIASLAAIACGSALSTGAAADLRSRVYRRATDFSTAAYHELGTPTMLTRTSLDTGVVTQAVFLTTSVAVTAPIITVGAVVLSLQASVQLAPVIVVAAVVLGVLVGVFVTFLTPLVSRLQQAVDTVNRVLREQLAGTRIIRAFRQEPAASTRFDEANRDLTGLARRVGALQLMLLPGVLLIANAATAATSLFGARLIENGDLTIGGLTAFTGYLTQIVVGITLLITLAAVFPRARVSAGRLAEVLDKPSGLPDDGGLVLAGPLSLDFRDVRVQYPGAAHAAVESVSLHCPAGSTCAIIGSTSSGKSSLLSLVPRLLDPSAGSVELGRVATTAWPLSDLRSTVAHVGQGRSLIAGTVASNLRLGTLDADDAALWRALTVAAIAETVVERGGLDAEVTQGGANFSGGQRQRLAIARALVRAPRVLCLDAAFSAMDRHTADTVLRGVRGALPTATILIADQQVENVRYADRIAVLDGRRIVDVGTHRELAARCPAYREFADAQAPTARTQADSR
ncbi:ABC transporter ATP-binding protein [Gordonia hydrophobica]|uniref:ABC transporter ATP-binding protein n=1 Tax=Gordonia hydrophobica TaxID=40516 RepID=A0ABZ2U2L4_9ACTN|nr:ABC transporter ATP-binding protein [Gordonia hydrophobica]MBM7367778.1 ATP-binding cassette subfamily B protein [Gordonia hydrophobica]